MVSTAPEISRHVPIHGPPRGGPAARARSAPPPGNRPDGAKHRVLRVQDR